MLLLPASPRLHAKPRLYRTNSIDGYPIHLGVLPSTRAISRAIGGDAQVGAVRVFTGEVEEVDAGENCQEAAEEGDGVDGVGGVEAAEEDEGGAEGAGCEGYVVEGVDSGVLVSKSQLWEKSR